MADHYDTAADAADVVRSPLIPREQVRWLYYSGYYDGPISGRIEVAGEPLWAQRFDECHHFSDDEDDDEPTCGFYRRYRLIRLAPDADAEEARRHGLFRNLVGAHQDIGADGRRQARFNPATHPDWHRFYEIQKTWPVWEPVGELVGWFER